VNYVVALAFGYAVHATLVPAPTPHNHMPLHTIATVHANVVPTPSPSLSPLPISAIRAYAAAGAAASGLDESLVLSVIEAESGGDPHAVSRAGAVGMMQLMPATASDCGIRSRWVAADNVRCGSKTLAILIRRYGLTKAIASYNAGATTIAAAGAHASKWPHETQTYVRAVVQRYDALQHS
jgi:soluble lytic murein transglycosylase-like protein